jgi:hypothetical protein
VGAGLGRRPVGGRGRRRRGPGARRTRGDKRVEQVEGRLEAAQRKAPDSAGLLLALADLRDLQEGYDDPEALYRRVLGLGPDNVQALNKRRSFSAWRRRLGPAL